jgi:Mrp family chromosome partitioning ATPase
MSGAMSRAARQTFDRVLESLNRMRTTVAGGAQAERSRVGQRNLHDKALTGPDMRRLVGSLDAEFAIEGLQGGATVLIAGAAPGEGCTTTALGLALSAASLDERRQVLLIDAGDGAAQEAFGIAADRAGLFDLMAEGANMSVANLAAPTHLPNLRVLPRGTDSRNRRIRSGALQRTLEDARRRFDLVIIDSAPLREEASALLLAQEARRALLVVRRARLPVTDLAGAADELRRSGAVVLGCVLNNARAGRRPS